MLKIRSNNRAWLWALTACAIFFGVSGIAAASQSQENFPSKPIRWVIPWGPGSTTDMLARTLSGEVSAILGVSVIVENKAGADGNIGAAYVSAAKPDGYTIMMGTASTNAVNVLLQDGLRYNPGKDFRAVAKLASIPNVLVVSKQIPATNVQELIALARKEPYSFGSTGAGGTVHLSGELFKNMTGLDLLHVPYKGGSTLLTDLLTARVQMMFCNIPLCISHIESGDLVALGITSAKPYGLLPEVPPIAEQGLPNFDIVGWYGVFAPAGVPDEAVGILNAAFNKALQSPQVSGVLKRLGAEVEITTPEEFDAFTREEQRRWKELVSQMDIQ